MQSMIRRMESVKSFFSCFDNSVSIDEFNEAIKEFDFIKPIALIAYKLYLKDTVFINGNEFFMSKTILIECPNEESQIIRVLQMIERIRSKSIIKIILATKENYYIPTFNKMLYEIVESSYTEDYMFN